MSNYIDGFVFPIHKDHIDEYKEIANQVSNIWKEHGALEYHEYLIDDIELEGIRSFIEATNAQKDEWVVFGWVVFPSKDIRETANVKVPLDKRMTALVSPLVDPKRLIFDASRMIYGGFKPLISNKK